MKTICDWENCKEIGSYKAPIERDNSKKFRLLCLKHIKLFNKRVNSKKFNTPKLNFGFSTLDGASIGIEFKLK